MDFYRYVCIRWKTLLVYLLNMIDHIPKHSTRIQTSSPKVHNTLDSDKLMKTSPPKASNENLPISHLHQPLLLLAEHSFFAFLLVSLIIFKIAAPSSGGNSLDPAQKLNCGAKHFGIGSELQIVTTHLYHLRNVCFNK